MASSGINVSGIIRISKQIFAILFPRYNLLKIDDKFFNKFLVDLLFVLLLALSLVSIRDGQKGWLRNGRQTKRTRFEDAKWHSVRGTKAKPRKHSHDRQGVRSRANREEGVVTSLKTRSVARTRSSFESISLGQILSDNIP